MDELPPVFKIAGRTVIFDTKKNLPIAFIDTVLPLAVGAQIELPEPDERSLPNYVVTGVRVAFHDNTPPMLLTLEVGRPGE